MSKIILTDELLKEAAAKAMKIECAVLEKCAAQEEEHEFSKEHERRIRELVRGNCGKAKVKPAKYRSNGMSLRIRIAFVAVVVMMMGSMTVLAVEPLREKVYQMIERIFSDHTEVSFEEIEQEIDEQKIGVTPENFVVRKLTKVPVQYRLESDEKDDIFFDYYANYMDEKGRALNYHQQAIDYVDTWVLTSDGESAKRIVVNGESAYLLSDTDGWKIILYLKDGCLYKLGGYEECDDLINILESAFTLE